MIWKQALAAIVFLTAGQAIASSPTTRKPTPATYDLVYGKQERVCKDALHLYNRLLAEDQGDAKRELSDFEVSRPEAFHRAGFLEPPSASQIYPGFDNGSVKARAYEVDLDPSGKPHIVFLVDRFRGDDPLTTAIVFKEGVFDPLVIKNAFQNPCTLMRADS